MLDNWCYRHILRICNTCCPSTATVVTRTRLGITLYVHCLSCLPLVVSYFAFPLAASNYTASPSMFINVCSETLQEFVLNVNIYVYMYYSTCEQGTGSVCLFFFASFSLFSVFLSYVFHVRFFIFCLLSGLLLLLLFFLFPILHLSYSHTFATPSKHASSHTFFVNGFLSSFIWWPIQFVLYYYMKIRELDIYISWKRIKEKSDIKETQ